MKPEYADKLKRHKQWLDRVKIQVLKASPNYVLVEHKKVTRMMSVDACRILLKARDKYKTDRQPKRGIVREGAA